MYINIYMYTVGTNSRPVSYMCRYIYIYIYCRAKLTKSFAPIHADKCIFVSIFICIYDTYIYNIHI